MPLSLKLILICT